MQGVYELPAVLFPAEILQRMGLGGGQMIMKKVRESLMNSMDEARALLKPSGIVVTIPLETKIFDVEFPEQCLKIKNNEFVEWAKDFSEISVYAVTLGEKMEEKIQQIAEGETKEDVFQYVAADALEQAGSVLIDQMIMNGVQNGYQIKQYKALSSSESDIELREMFLKILVLKGEKENLDISPFISDFSLVGAVGNIPFEKLNW